MHNMIRHILNPEIPLRKRLFQLLSTIALAEFVIVSIYTIVIDQSLSHVMLMLVGTLFFTLTVAYTFRSGRMRFGSTVSALLYYSLYPMTFFSSGGMYGGAPVVFAFALVYVFLATERWERVVSLSACILTSIFCYVLSYRQPELLVRHTTAMEHIESMLSICLVVLLLCTLFAFVTEVYKAENRIVQKQKKEIEDLNRSQKRFFSSMSHEIRTPVNAILGLNEMILKENLSAEVRENAENIEVAGKILLHTINEILDMSRLETGSMEIINSSYRTTKNLSDIVGMVWLQAREKGLEFNVTVDPEVPGMLCGDEVRIRQVLLNVTTNAVKYTKEGSVTLKIGCRTRDDGTFFMTYDVQDTGIGIREEDIPHLFTAFSRVDAGKTHQIEGTGLGLSIVKQLLDMMGGTVTVSSQYGRGTVFHIEIPQEIVDERPVGEVDLSKRIREDKTEEEVPFTAPSLRILAVDDTPMNLMVVKKLLKDTMAEVDTAASGKEALEKTALTCYHVILMDHQMPEMDGIECLHRIRDQGGGKCRDSKIMCLTANAGSDMEKLYLGEGFDGYLMKPVRGKTLKKELARLAPQICRENSDKK